MIMIRILEQFRAGNIMGAAKGRKKAVGGRERGLTTVLDIIK